MSVEANVRTSAIGRLNGSASLGYKKESGT